MARIDPSQVSRLSLESFERALGENRAEIETRAAALGVTGDVADQLRRVAFNVVFDAGELTIAGVREEGLLCEGAAAAAKLLEGLLTSWLGSGRIEIDATFDRTPIDAKQLRAQIAARSPESLAEADLALQLLDPRQTGLVTFGGIKALRADVIHLERDLNSPVAASTQLLRAFLMTASEGELARLLPGIRPGAERFTQPFESLASKLS